VRRAVFLDRDGTIIENVHHLADPALVRLIPGAAKGIQMLRDRGFVCVVVSNQSAVGRGLLTLETLELIHQEMCRQLAQAGTAVDGWYFCPEAPKTSDRTAIDHPDRKPAPGMLLRAAKELDLEVDSSWMVGDMVSDVMAGHNAGCMGTIIVKTGFGGDQTEANALATYVAKDLLLAAQWLIAKE
jgi:D-glycero-D-manno-heptose 1,7-bisphosphate phosphatase